MISRKILDRSKNDPVSFIIKTLQYAAGVSKFPKIAKKIGDNTIRMKIPIPNKFIALRLLNGIL